MKHESPKSTAANFCERPECIKARRAYWRGLRERALRGDPSEGRELFEIVQRHIDESISEIIGKGRATA